MSTRDRAGLVARIRQIRGPAAPERPAPPGDLNDSDRIRALEIRLGHLEELVEGFQDSVHRESARQSRRTTDLEARTEPAAIAAALSQDARERGL